MSDTTLTVNEGERILHDGKFLDPGDTFKLSDEAAQVLIDAGRCTEGKKAKPSTASDSNPVDTEPPATGKVEDDGSEDSKVPEGDAKTLIANVSSYSEEELAAILDQEKAASKPRATVVDAVKAEQKSRKS